MSEWERHAKAGRWDLIHWDDPNSVPKRDWPKFLHILQVLVPKLERRDGIEHREAYAGQHDLEAITDWVDSGRYDQALTEVGWAFPGVRAAAPSPAEEHRQSVETEQQRAERTARLVQHAAALLDGLTAVMEEEKPWHTRAEEVAIEALRAAGIEYRACERPGSSRSLQVQNR